MTSLITNACASDVIGATTSSRLGREVVEMSQKSGTSLTDKLEAFFRDRPLTWIDGKTLAQIAGGYAWRTRTSELRKRGMVIENRVTTRYTAGQTAFKASEYRYVPSAKAA